VSRRPALSLPRLGPLSTLRTLYFPYFGPFAPGCGSRQLTLTKRGGNVTENISVVTSEEYAIKFSKTEPVRVHN